MVDRSAVGRSFTPVTARVEPGRLRYFLNTIGERNAVYRDDAAARTAGYPAAPIPPTYLFCLELMDAERPFEFLTELGIDLARVLHGEQRFTYRAPVGSRRHSHLQIARQRRHRQEGRRDDDGGR